MLTQVHKGDHFNFEIYNLNKQTNKILYLFIYSNTECPIKLYNTTRINSLGTPII